MNESPVDQSAYRLFWQITQRLVDLAGIKPGATVLIVEPSGEAVTTYAVAKVGPMGQVIPFARKTNDELCLANLEQLYFADATFDCILWPAAIVLLPDMAAGLREWRRVLKPGGTVAFSGYGERSFQPLAKLFETCLRRYDVNLPSRPFAWQRLTDLEIFSDLLRSAAFSAIDVRSEQVGYFLANGDEWWNLLWLHEFYSPLHQLPLDVLRRFKAEHLAEVAQLATARGIWLNVTAIFAVGQKGDYLA